MPYVGDSSYCPRKAASQSVEVPPWDSPRSHTDESNWQKLFMVEWAGQRYWNPCKVMFCVSNLASHSPSCTSASMGMAGHTLEKGPCGLCRTISGENVLHHCGCPLEVAWSHPNVRYYFTPYYWSSALCAFTFWPPGPTCLRQWSSIYIRRKTA